MLSNPNTMNPGCALLQVSIIDQLKHAPLPRGLLCQIWQPSASNGASMK